MTDEKNIKERPVRVKCIFWPNVDVKPLLKYDSGELVIRKVIDKLKSVEKLRNQ